MLVMTVNPGFGHQHFLHNTLSKILRVRRMVEKVNPRCEVEVDGGLTRKPRRWRQRRAQMYSWPGRPFLATRRA